MRRSVLFIVLVFLLALVGACVESDDDDADDTEDDSAAVTETETAEPTEEATATEEPTEEPEATEEPEETATPESEETAMAEPEETVTAEPEETATEEPDDEDGEDGEEHVVEIQDNFFEPDELEVAAGDTIRFVNEGEIVHTSTLDPEVARDADNAFLPDGAETWDSGELEPGDEFSVTLDVPGEYGYFCIPHEAMGMVGTITVTDGDDGGMDGDTDDDDDSDEDEDDG